MLDKNAVIADVQRALNEVDNEVTGESVIQLRAQLDELATMIDSDGRNNIRNRLMYVSTFATLQTLQGRKNCRKVVQEVLAT